MSWMELSIDTTHEAVDWISSLLSATEYEGDIHIREYAASDPSAPVADHERPDWAFTVQLYLPCDRHTNSLVDEIADRLSPLQRTGLATELQIAVVKEKPSPICEQSALIRRIGQRFVVLAGDLPYAARPDQVVIRLNSSTAFGSGLHPATQLSLQLIERYATPAISALDFGSGSGILSVAMAKLGAKVLALDNDEIAVQASQNAVQQNQLTSQVVVRSGSLGSGSSLGHWMGLNPIATVPTFNPTAEFDLIVANILARVHIALAPDFQRALRQTETHRGLLITAGFTVDYQNEVDAALVQAGFEAIDTARFNEWVAFVHRLRP